VTPVEPKVIFVTQVVVGGNVVAELDDDVAGGPVAVSFGGSSVLVEGRHGRRVRRVKPRRGGMNKK